MTEVIRYHDIEITKDEEVSEKEVKAYVDYLIKKHPKRQFESITMTIDPEEPTMINLKYKMKPVSFERIRRITGYLVGTMDKWNDGKAAEEKDRVKHDTNSSGLEQL